MSTFTPISNSPNLGGEYRGLIAISYLTPVGLALTGSTGPILVTPLSLPFALEVERAVAATEGHPLNPLLAATAKLVAIFGLLFALGLSARVLLSHFGLTSQPWR